jgi:hypothetical protein
MAAGVWDITRVISRNTAQRVTPWLLTVAAVPWYVMGWIVGASGRAIVFVYASAKAGFVDGAGIMEGKDANTTR